MNKRIAKIYVCLTEGKAILADTNLKSLSEDLTPIAPDISYTVLYNNFRETDSFSKKSKNGNTYSFQVIVNKDYKA